MSPALLVLLSALTGVCLGALLVWLLLRSRDGGADATQALGQSLNQSIARLDSQLAGLVQSNPAELARLRDALLTALSQQRQEFGGTLEIGRASCRERVS
jgi:hypothetical protein